MDFKEYQRLANTTDQAPGAAAHRRHSGDIDPTRAEVIPLLGMVGEVGSLLAEYKKLLRDGATHRRFKDKVREELGDILWYVANVASKFDLRLEDIAQDNLNKLQHRYGNAPGMRFLPDDDQQLDAQLPRTFEYSFDHRDINGARRLVLIDQATGAQLGDPLSDNTYDPDGYRFHDILHLTFAARFGWSPVYRKLLRKAGIIKNRRPTNKDDAEDGGRAQVAEEAIVLAAYSYAATQDLMENVAAFDWELLRHVEKLVVNLESRVRTSGEWNDALLRGFEIWRLLRASDGGIVRGDLRAGTIDFSPPVAT